MFTHGSRWVIIGSDVSACTTAAPPSGSPTTSATRAHSWRAARILAIVMNWSSSAASRKLICRRRLADRDPGFGEHPQVGHRGRDAAGQLPRRVGAQVVEGGSVDGDRPHAVVGGHPRGDRDDILDRGSGTVAQRRGQRVGAQVDRQRGALVGFHLGDQRQHGVAGRRVVGARVEDHRRHAQVHTLEQRRRARPVPRRTPPPGAAAR